MRSPSHADTSRDLFGCGRLFLKVLWRSGKWIGATASQRIPLKGGDNQVGQSKSRDDLKRGGLKTVGGWSEAWCLVSAQRVGSIAQYVSFQIGVTRESISEAGT